MLRSNEKIASQTGVSLKDIVRQNEIICTLDLSENKEAEAYQEDLAASLADIYATGGIDVASDKWKVKKYLRQAKKPTNIPDTIYRTQTGYEAFAIFNDTRLFTSRLVQLLNATKAIANNTLNTVISGLGLAFAVRLAFDLAIVVKNVFRPETEEEKELGAWQRFKNALYKDNRMYRILNDVLWLSVNVTTFIISGGLSLAGFISVKAFIGIVGMACETSIELYKWCDVTEYQQVYNNVCSRIRGIKARTEYQAIIKQIEEKSAAIEIAVLAGDIDKLHAEIADLKNSKLYREHEKLIHIEVKLADKLAEVKRNRQYAIAIVSLVFLGVILTLVPFTMPAGFVIVGAAFSLGAGSIMAGLGRRIYEAIKAKNAANQEDQEIAPNSNLVVNRALHHSMPAAQLVDQSLVAARPRAVSVNASGSFFRRNRDKHVSYDELDMAGSNYYKVTP